MTDNRHFRRLEHIYASTPSDVYSVNDVAVALGRAELNSQIESDQLSPQDVATHTHYHELLCDAAALAAGSLIEDQLVTVEQFDMRVMESGHSGSVVVSARVALAQPPRFHVEAELRTEEGEVLARGIGRFARSTVELPPDPHPDADGAEPSKRRDPAVYASVWASPFGILHLN